MSEERQFLQVKCDRVAPAISERIGHRCKVTLIAFYKQIAARGWAFATSLPDLEATAITLEAVVAGWCGAMLPPRNAGCWLPHEQQVKDLGELCREQLPFSCGYILVFGVGVDTRATSSEPDDVVSNLLAHMFIPAMQERLQESAQPTEPK